MGPAPGILAGVTRRGALLFAAMALVWGVPYLFIRVAVRDLDPAVIVGGRSILGALVLLPFALRSGALRPVLGHWRWIAVFAIVEMAVPWYLLTDAERHLSSSLTGLLVASVPLVAALLAVLSRTERFTGIRLVGLLVGVAGVFALLGLDLDTGGGGARPIVEMLVVAVCYAAGPFVLARRLSGLPGLGVSMVSLGIAGILYLVPMTLRRPTAPVPAVAWWSVAVLALVCTALAFVLFYELIAEIGPSRATVITYLNPAVALLLGVLLLGEPLTVGMVVGFPLVLLGSVLATRPSRTVGSGQSGDVAVDDGDVLGGGVRG